MASLAPVSMFMAATSLLVGPGLIPATHAQGSGGLLEWTTDQAIDAESEPDAEASALRKKAEQEDVCVPIGEGENCW